MIRFTSILSVVSASLYLSCGSAEASSFATKFQKKAQAALKTHGIKTSFRISEDDVPPPILRKVGLSISVIKGVELPSGEVTNTEVCSFNEQIPLYDMRQAPDQYTIPNSTRICDVVLNGKNTSVQIPVFTFLTRAEKMGSLPVSDVKVFGTFTWVSEGDIEGDFAFSATRDLQVWNLLAVSNPTFKSTTGTIETITVNADMNELQ